MAIKRLPTLDTQVSYTEQGHTSKEINSETTKDYGYNTAERLISYSSAQRNQPNLNLEVDYRYDPFGRRIAKSVKQDAITVTTYFIYTDSGLMAETDDAGKLTRAYGFNPQAAEQGLWSTDPIWQASIGAGRLIDADAAYSYLHTDHLDTPILATSNSGTINWMGVGEAFGDFRVLPESSIVMNLRFPGQYHDDESGGTIIFTGITILILVGIYSLIRFGWMRGLIIIIIHTAPRLDTLTRQGRFL